MSISIESVRVTICGQDYNINSDVDTETIRKIAAFVNKTMTDIRRDNPLRDSLKIAILSALTIAGELYEYKEKYEMVTRQLNELQSKVSSLNKRLENSILTTPVS